MKHIWSVLCQKSSIDSETNLLSLFSCVEQVEIAADKIPDKQEKIVLPVQFELIGFWTIDHPEQDNSLEFKVVILDPTGKELHAYTMNYQIKKGNIRFRNRVKFPNMPISGEGRYLFQISQKKAGSKKYEIESELPVDVKISYKMLIKDISSK